MPLVNIRRSAPRRLRKLYGLLVASYGPQSWWPAKTPLEVVLGAYLTQNTSWRGVELSIQNLRRAGALSLKTLRQISDDDLRLLIRPSGYMVRKAAAIRAFFAFLDRDFFGSLKRMRAQNTTELRKMLLELPGVGPETADAILLYALEHPVMVVDEYFRRVAFRHWLTSENPKYQELQTLAESAFTNDHPTEHLQHFNEFHALMVEVGKRHCGPAPRCEGCPLATDLPRGGPRKSASQNSSI